MRYLGNSQFWHFWNKASSFLAKNSNIWKIPHPLPYLMLLNCFKDQEPSFSEALFCSNISILENNTKILRIWGLEKETEFLIRKNCNFFSAEGRGVTKIRNMAENLELKKAVRVATPNLAFIRNQIMKKYGNFRIFRKQVWKI